MKIPLINFNIGLIAVGAGLTIGYRFADHISRRELGCELMVLVLVALCGNLFWSRKEETKK